MIRRLALSALVVMAVVALLRLRPESRLVRKPNLEPAPRGAPSAMAPPAEPEPAPPVTRVIELPTEEPAARREARLELVPPVRDWAEDGALPEAPPLFRFFDGVERELDLTSHEDGAYEGEGRAVPGSWVVLAHVDDAVAGTLVLPGGGVYRVRTRPGGELRLTEIDPSRIQPELEPLVAPDVAGTAVTGGATPLADAATT